MRNVRALVTIGTLLGVAACGAGADGPAGPDGKNGTNGAAGAAGQDGKNTSGAEASINLVSPRAAVLGAEIEVTVSIDGALDPAATVAFGDGVKVNSKRVAGSSIVAVVEVDPKTTLGPRDVIVTNGSAKLTATQGFQVAASLGVKITGGKAEQGGLVQVDLLNNDAEWFNPDSFEVFGLLTAADGALVPLSTGFVGPKDARVILLADPTLKTGPLALAATNYPEETDPPLYLSGPGALTVAARTPEALTATEVSKVITQPFETHLLRYTTAANKLNVVTIVPNASLSPFVLGMGKAGKLSDILAQTATQVYPTLEAGSGTLIVANRTFAQGGADPARFGFKARAQSLDAEAPVAEQATKHDGTGNPGYQDWGAAPPDTTAATPVRLLRGDLATDDTADVYRLGPFPAGSVNLEISAHSEVPVSIQISDNIAFPSGGGQTTTIALGYSSSFFGSQENGAKIANGARAGTANFRYVRVRPFNSKRGKYTLAARRLP